MKAEQRRKISEALKKAWRAGKFKKVFGRPLKKTPETKAVEIEYRIKDLSPKTFLEIFLENGTSIWASIETKRLKDFLKRLNIAMRYGFPIESMNYGTIFHFSNEEGPTFNCLNGVKIIGYRF